MKTKRITDAQLDRLDPRNFILSTISGDDVVIQDGAGIITAFTRDHIGCNWPRMIAAGEVTGEPPKPTLANAFTWYVSESNRNSWDAVVIHKGEPFMYSTV